MSERLRLWLERDGGPAAEYHPRFGPMCPGRSGEAEAGARP